MINNIRLEWYKKGKGHVVRAFIPVLITSLISVVIFIMTSLLAEFDLSRMLEYIGETAAMQAEMDKALADISNFQMLSQLVISVFMVFTGVMYAKYVVSDFKSGMIEQMYLYPIKKQTIIISKILSAAFLGFIGAILTFILGVIAIKVLRYETNLSLSIVIDIILSSFVSVVIPLISMIIGLWRKSTIWTIVSSVLLAMMFAGNWGWFTLSDFPFVSYIVAIIAIVATIITIRKLVKKDCLQ